MPGSDLALIETAARAAGEIALSYWKRSPEVWDKGNDDPVSAADLAVDAYLKDHLLAARPDHGWLSEETADDGARLERERVFIVDPIDGTRSFLKGEDTWGVSVALVEGGRPIAGAVVLPARGTTYAAERGRPATRDGEAMQVSRHSGGEGASVLARKSAMRDEYWPGGVPAVRRGFRPSIAYRLCLVAEGRYDAMISLGPVWEWDIAAGALIAEAAGATVTDAEGAPLAFNAPSARQPGIVVAGERLHGALTAKLIA